MEGFLIKHLQNAVCTDCTIVYLLSTDSKDGKQKKICYQGCCDKVHRKPQPHPRLLFAVIVVILKAFSPPGYYSTKAESIQERVGEPSGDVEWDMEREKHNNIYSQRSVSRIQCLRGSHPLTGDHENNQCYD